jgi:hypothetical protein
MSTDPSSPGSELASPSVAFDGNIQSNRPQMHVANLPNFGTKALQGGASGGDAISRSSETHVSIYVSLLNHIFWHHV